MKIAADEANAIPADANAISEPLEIDHADDANRSATTVGIVLWKTIAPVMFPMASVSLLWRTQMHAVELLGELGRDRGHDQREQHLGDARASVASRSTAPTKTIAPSMIRPSDASTWNDTIRRRGAGCRSSSRRRRAVAGAAARGRPATALLLGLEVLADVPRVDQQQHGGGDPARPDDVRRHEGDADRERVRDGEIAHVVGEYARGDRHHAAAGAPPATGDHSDAR